MEESLEGLKHRCKRVFDAWSKVDEQTPGLIAEVLTSYLEACQSDVMYRIRRDRESIEDAE